MQRPTTTVARAAARELGLIAAAGVTYAAVRAVTEGSTSRAMENGRRILRLERSLHLGWEQTLQAPVLEHTTLVKLADGVYIWGFWPVLAGAALYLYVLDRGRYVLLRNAVLCSGAIGFLFFDLLPVAPPRLVDPNLVDTIREYSAYYRPIELSELTNQYASLPSLHFGWTLLVGIMVAAASRRSVGVVFAVLLPAAIGLAVVVTANHYVIDVIVGGAVALAALALASRVPAAQQTPAPHPARS